MSIQQQSDKSIVYTTVGCVSPLTLVIEECNTTGMTTLAGSIIRENLMKVIGMSTDPQIEDQFGALQDWVRRHVSGRHTQHIVGITCKALLAAQTAGFVGATTVTMICHLTQMAHTSSEAASTRMAVWLNDETKQDTVVRLLCNGRAVGDKVNQITWVAEFVATAQADMHSPQHAFLQQYQRCREFPLSEANEEFARTTINGILRLSTDKFSRQKRDAAQ